VGCSATKPLEEILCDPVSYLPLKAHDSGVRCERSGLYYRNVDDTYLDLTPAGGSLRPPLPADHPASKGDSSLPLPIDVQRVAETIERVTQGRLRPTEFFQDGYTGDRAGVGVTTFQNPFVSQIYERGWRQSFSRAGFPGPDKEFEQAQKWLLPVAENGVILDASCGSGLFTRRFVTSAKYDQVIALDFSESMLQQTAQLCKENSLWSGGPSSLSSNTSANPILVRGDIARMPFASESIDGVHAGAAIHCWPAPALALSEISRILKPGGRAVLSTFMNPQIPFTDERTRKAVFGQLSQNSVIRAWEEGELRGLAESVGLRDFECNRNREFIIFKVEKPKITD